MRRWPFLLVSLLHAMPALALDLPQGCLAELVKLNRRLTGNAFSYLRGLSAYQVELGPAFTARLNKLGPEDQWLDSGAGAGTALAEYQMATPLMNYEGTPFDFKKLPRNRARTLGVTLALPPEAAAVAAMVERPTALGAHRMIGGKSIESIPVGEMGQCSLITDVYGAFAYSLEPDVVLSQYLKLLKVGGMAILKFGSEQSFVTTPSGEVEIAAFLTERLAGHGITALTSANGKVTGLILEKTADGPLDIPRLSLDLFFDGKPPHRYFKLK